MRPSIKLEDDSFTCSQPVSPQQGLPCLQQVPKLPPTFLERQPGPCSLASLKRNSSGDKKAVRFQVVSILSPSFSHRTIPAATAAGVAEVSPEAFFSSSGIVHLLSLVSLL